MAEDEYKRAFPGIYILGDIIKGDWTLSKDFKIIPNKHGAASKKKGAKKVSRTNKKTR